MEMLSKFTIPGALFLFTLVFGFWLSYSGKPYHGLLFNAHKLIALAGVVIAVVQLSKSIHSDATTTWLVLSLVTGTLSILALFISGALMSAEKLDYTLMLSIHRVAPIILSLAAAGVLILLQKGVLQ